MAITLGTNIPALNTRYNLNGITDSLSQIYERITTGHKINKAADDASGLVISQNMEAVVRGSKQAHNNIQTAKSFLTVAEDGMVSISDHFQRINDLLVNMANDTNDTGSRTAAIEEIIERLDEINRLADSTVFNGMKMIDGSSDSIIVQMGPDATEDSTLDISKALTDCHASTLLGTPGILLPDNLTPGHADFEPNNENCRAYMTTVQNAISKLATNRGLIGAFENRMDSSYDSLSARIESLEAAKAVYTDTDIAEASTELAKKQILQQINVSILSSANTNQQLALSLLAG